MIVSGAWDLVSWRKVYIEAERGGVSFYLMPRGVIFYLLGI